MPAQQFGNARIQDFLAGLYELPNVEGHLTKKAALAQVKDMGLEPLRIEALPDAKHIFHILNGGCALTVSRYLLWKKHLGKSSCLQIRENLPRNMQYHLRFAHTPDT